MPTPTEPARFASQAAFKSWLKREHARADGTWLVFAKAGAPTSTVTYPQAIEVALCFGWVDGQKKGIDEHFWMQRFTPRRARSVWSKINCAKAEALMAAGLMQPAGLAEVERAKADGRWESAYDGARSSTVPDDLRAALEARPRAHAFFVELDATNRYAVLWRIQTAIKPETRARRIETLVAMLERGERIHPVKSRAG